METPTAVIAESVHGVKTPLMASRWISVPSLDASGPRLLGAVTLVEAQGCESLM